MTTKQARVALLTDSSAQLTADLIERYGVAVIPVTIALDGHEFREGVDMDADAFYAAHRPDSELSTSQPSPGLFVEAVEQAAQAGASEVLAVLVGSAYSGTVQSARVAASQTSIPLRIVDTGTASFGVSCCLLAAAESLASGGSLEVSMGAARSMALTVETVFVLQGLELAALSGRFQQIGLTSEPARTQSEEGIMVLWSGQGQMEVIATAFSVEEAVQAMADRVLGPKIPIRVASSLAGPAMAPMSEALDRLLERDPLVEEILRYRVGPSVAAQTGPGTAGVFYYPA